MTERQDARRHQDQLNQRDEVVQALMAMSVSDAMEYIEESVSPGTLRDIVVGYLDWNSSHPDSHAQGDADDLYYRLGLDQPQTLTEVQAEESRYFNRYQR